MLTADRFTDLEDDIDSIMETIVANNKPSAPVSRSNLGNTQISIESATRRGRPNTITKSNSTENTNLSKRRSFTQKNTSRRLNQSTGLDPMRYSGPDSTKEPAPINHSARNPKYRQPTTSRTHPVLPYENTDLSQTKSPNTTKDHTGKRSKQPRQNKKKSLSIALVVFSLIIVPVLTLTVFKKPILAFLEPKTPFSNELQQKLKIPLYYPTKPPSGYKIELNSIAQPQDDVAVYVMTNDSDKKINISLQKQPSNIDLSPVYAKLNDTNEIGTKFGQVKYGTSDQGLTIVNIMTGQSWVILTFEANQINQSQLKSLIDSLTY